MSIKSKGMPRRPRPSVLVEDKDDVEFFSPRHLVVQEYFRDWLWDKLKGDLGNCCVCEQPAHACKHCTAITVCGHTICQSCLHRLKKIQCPVCRFPSS
jgi:hypothetical protein